jgi:hypothetical protein
MNTDGHVFEVIHCKAGIIFTGTVNGTRLAPNKRILHSPHTNKEGLFYNWP